MQIPELQANVEVELGTGQNTTEIAMQRPKIMSKAEREEIARIIRCEEQKQVHGCIQRSHAIIRAIPPTNATAVTTAPTRPPLTAGMPRAPPF